MRRALPLLALLLLGALAAAPPARADDPPALPDLVGQREADAVAALEALGLEARVVTIAADDAPAGEVVHQDPPAGVAYAAGDEVTLRVGVTVRIPTVAPGVVGLPERDAVAALKDAYFLEVEYLSGPAAREGRVLRQQPEPGTSVLHRSRFLIQVVRNTAVVPALLGKRLDAALDLLESVGLRAEVLYRRDDAAAAGTVVSQDPRSGAEIIPGGTVEVRVAGEPPAGGPPAGTVGVPNVVGMTQVAAEHALLAAGLTSHMHWTSAEGHAAGTVVSQEVAPGTRVAEGTNVGFEVAQPRTLPSQVPVPNLFGMTEAHAVSVLVGAGLSAYVQRVPSAFPVGTVFAQGPDAGTMLPVGGRVDLKVALAPPPSWTPPARQVPDVRGMSSEHARLALLLGGYIPHKRHGLAPESEIGRVFDQAPVAGTPAPFGTIVEYFLPYTSTVPALVDKTRDEALAALSAASLDGQAILVGPGGPGDTQVTWQQWPAGAEVARQSKVKFRYKVLGPVMKPVPDVVGLTKGQAHAKITAEGFVPNLVLAGGWGVGTKVTQQFPGAGTPRPVGSVVNAKYVRVPVALQKPVPAVVGMTKEQAVAAIVAAGFQANMVLLGGFGNSTRVDEQSPAANAMRPAGSVVTAKYRRVLVGIVLKPVPNVIGLTRVQAQQKIQAEGFVANLVQAPGIGTSTTVIAQNPAAGAMRAVGSAVTATWKHTLVVVPVPLPMKIVPNVKGKFVNLAKNQLEAAGFEVQIQGIGIKVKSQSPVGGQFAAQGSKVKITLEF
jgi:beta-lactam-binding protein with PASTA domain